MQLGLSSTKGFHSARIEVFGSLLPSEMLDYLVTTLNHSRIVDANIDSERIQEGNNGRTKFAAG